MSPGDPPFTPLDTLARAILEQGDAGDLTDIYEALKPFMPYHQFQELGLKLELCPVHFCDIRICADDEIHGDEVYAR